MTPEVVRQRISPILEDEDLSIHLETGESSRFVG